MLWNKGAIGLCSAIGTLAGGVVIFLGGHYWYNSKYPTGDRELINDGYMWNIPSPKMRASAANPSQVFKEKKPQGCFQNFFPGVVVDRYTDDTKEDTEDQSLPALSFTPEDGKSEVNPVGCLLFDFSFQKVDWNTINDKWALNGEITIKNDKFGWSLWVTGRQDNKSSPDVNSGGSVEKTSLMYCLLFLKKEDRNWNLMGGYTWKDYSFSDAGNTNFHVNVPTGEGGALENWFGGTDNLKQGEFVNQQYSGIWTESANGKEVLEEIELWAGGDDEKATSAEILGTQKLDFDLIPSGYENVYMFYDKEKQKWIKTTYSGDNSISENLKKLYEPFRGKKGKLTEFSEVEKECRKWSGSREYSSENLDYLKKFCYTKKNK